MVPAPSTATFFTSLIRTSADRGLVLAHPAGEVHGADDRSNDNARVSCADLANMPAMTSLPRLVAIPYSPWSIKAKWALDHHGIEYRYVHYLPLLGEPLLKAVTRRLRRRSSVPVLLTRDGPIQGSLAIARYAESQGGGKPLFPRFREDAVSRWNACSEVALEAGRALALARVLRSRPALVEHVPGPRVLGELLAPMSALGIRYVTEKYGAVGGAGPYREELRWALEKLRAALADGDHLLGTFSYADVSMVAATFFVRPPGPGRDHLGTASRACWTDEEVAGAFEDVLAWRDRMLAACFPASEATRALAS